MQSICEYIVICSDHDMALNLANSAWDILTIPHIHIRPGRNNLFVCQDISLMPSIMYVCKQFILKTKFDIVIISCKIMDSHVLTCMMHSSCVAIFYLGLMQPWIGRGWCGWFILSREGANAHGNVFWQWISIYTMLFNLIYC